MERKIIDETYAKLVLPKRAADGNKGSFGKALLLVGSEKYRGAPQLVTEAALRGGAGYVTLASEKTVTDSVLSVFPEALFSTIPPFCALGDSDIESICALDGKNSATVIGSGASVSDGLRKLTLALLCRGNSPLVVDADAINALSLDREASVRALTEASRTVVLTPHPLEFSRITGIPVEEINASREAAAEDFAKRTGCIVLLKGKGSVITDGRTTLVNSSGSSALAKAGSGDTLAGLLVSLLASGESPLKMTALAAYVHGAAGDTLAEEFSSFGVTPSDLPRRMASILATLEAEK
jgi:NAD(P)H-hydrate epimerase